MLTGLLCGYLKKGIMIRESYLSSKSKNRDSLVILFRFRNIEVFFFRVDDKPLGAVGFRRVCVLPDAYEPRDGLPASGQRLSQCLVLQVRH